MYKLLMIIGLLFLMACSEENTINKAKAKFVVAKTLKEQRQALAPLRKIAEQGNADIQAIYLAITDGCIMKTDKGLLRFADLLEAGNKVAQFMIHDSFLSHFPQYCGKQIFSIPPRAFAKEAQTLKWLENSASQGYVPSKIALARSYYYHNKTNSDKVSIDNLLVARTLLREAVTIVENEEIDILQREWSKTLLEDGFADDVMQTKTTDPLLRIYRLQLLTMLNPDWQVALTVAKHSPQRIFEKYSLINDVYHSKYTSINQLPYDADAQESVVIADKLLSQILNQLETTDEVALEQNQYYQQKLSTAGKQALREEAEKHRNAFAQQQLDAKNGDGEAMWKLYVKYDNLPNYAAETEKWLEAMMNLAKHTDDDRVVGIISSHFSIKNDAKRMQLLRRCANFPNASCMENLAKEIILSDKDNYTEGILWVYKAMEHGNQQAESLLTLMPRHDLGDWSSRFFKRGYSIQISDSLACHAAQFIELKQPERQYAWSDKITPPELFYLFLRGAETGNEDCINRLIEHYAYLYQDEERQYWQNQLR